MTYVAWIDSNHSKLFKLATGKMDLHTVNRSNTLDLKNEEYYFHEVAKALKGAQELLLVGPGLAKTHFVAHLKHHHHMDLAKKVVGVETVDHPTEPEILAIARKFFKSHDMFV